MLLSHHPYPFSQTLGLSEFQGKREVYHEGTVFWKCTPNEDDTPTSHNAHDHTWSRIPSQRKCCNSGWWGGAGAQGMLVVCWKKKEKNLTLVIMEAQSWIDVRNIKYKKRGWKEGHDSQEWHCCPCDMSEIQMSSCRSLLEVFHWLPLSTRWIADSLTEHTRTL